MGYRLSRAVEATRSIGPAILLFRATEPSRTNGKIHRAPHSQNTIFKPSWRMLVGIRPVYAGSQQWLSLKVRRQQLQCRSKLIRGAHGDRWLEDFVQKSRSKKLYGPLRKFRYSKLPQDFSIVIITRFVCFRKPF